jgi:putative ABC transport system substrate-binding protein
VSSDNDLDRIFATLAEKRVGGIVYGPDPFFVAHGNHVGALATRYAIPSVTNLTYNGVIISYGTKATDGYHDAAGYVAKILNGSKPADLPILQPVKFHLAVDLKAAKALGLTVPPALLATADEVIE